MIWMDAFLGGIFERRKKKTTRKRQKREKLVVDENIKRMKRTGACSRCHGNGSWGGMKPIEWSYIYLIVSLIYSECFFLRFSFREMNDYNHWVSVRIKIKCKHIYEVFIIHKSAWNKKHGCKDSRTHVRSGWAGCIVDWIRSFLALVAHLVSFYRLCRVFFTHYSLTRRLTSLKIWMYTPNYANQLAMTPSQT